VTASPPDTFVCRAPHIVFLVRHNESSVEVSLRGEFDLSSTTASIQVIEYVTERIAEAPRALVVDMSGVTFFDAAGIKFLVRLKDTAKLVSTTFDVRSPRRDVRNLLAVLGLSELIEQE
jgi:anti-anti-sigma factor